MDCLYLRLPYRSRISTNSRHGHPHPRIRCGHERVADIVARVGLESLPVGGFQQEALVRARFHRGGQDRIGAAWCDVSECRSKKRQTHFRTHHATPSPLPRKFNNRPLVPQTSQIPRKYSKRRKQAANLSRPTYVPNE